MNQQLLMPTEFPVTCHTDFVGKGTIFVAIKGFKQNGIDYIPLALEKGAQTIVIDQEIQLSHNLQLQLMHSTAKVIRVQNTRQALALLSAKAADYPADQLSIIGITGTKGKTTTSFLLEHILQSSGHKTALLTTVHNKIEGRIFSSSLTTPQPDYLHQFLKLCVQQKIRYVIMEVAAQALSMHRIAGIFFDGIIFTNFSQEHGEFYSSLESYFQAKYSIMEHAKPNIPFFINKDDIWCSRLLERYPKLETFGLQHDSNWNATLEQEMPHLTMTIDNKKEFINYQVSIPSLLGEFNAYNVLAANGMALKLGISVHDIIKAAKTFDSVPGRMQRYQLPNGALCIIDYAHNPASFQQLFSCLKKLTSHLIVVFGAGGERAQDKRPVMGSIAALYAEKVILTSDNPRSENPFTIIENILSGIPKEKRSEIIVEIDREQAIKKAYKYSQSNSIIVLLGKGPDEYQIIGTKKHFFSEASIIKTL